MASGNKFEHYYAVIMAGGGGTRLWPLSRSERPKQMLRLVGEESLFQTAVMRLDGLFPAERIYVVTVKEQAEVLQKQCPEIPNRNFILEPLPRGTASVVGLAGAVLQNKDPRAVMAILTADHYIGNIERFHQLLKAAHDVALEGYLVTLGIEPTYPATGYGYIQSGEIVASSRGLEVLRVLRFKEKPDEVQAVEMLERGNHTWNSGMFVWRVNDIMDEFYHQMPDLSAGLAEIANDWGTSQEAQTVQRVWSSIKAQTIDYGIMENAQDVVMIPASGLKWSDVGSWDSLFDLLPADKDGNIIMSGEHLGLETRNSLIYGNEDQGRLIVTLGVENLVVVDSGDVLLVCSIEDAQRVRQVVNQLKEEKSKYV